MSEPTDTSREDATLSDGVVADTQEAPQAVPEDATLSDGTVVHIATDFEVKSADGSKTTIPFLVQLTKPNGDSLSYEADDLSHASDALSLCVELDRLGYVRR